MLRQVSDPIKAMLTCDMRESRTIKIDGFSCEVGVQILWTCFRGRWSNQNRARRPGSRRGPVGRSTPGIYCRPIQLCRAAMGAMCGCCGEAPPAAPSRAPGLPFSFFSFVRLWAPVPLRAPPAGVVWGSIAPQTVAGRADGRTEIKRVQFSSVQFSGVQAWRFLRQASIRFVCVPLVRPQKPLCLLTLQMSIKGPTRALLKEWLQVNSTPSPTN